jgi:acyl carrier protein
MTDTKSIMTAIADYIVENFGLESEDLEYDTPLFSSNLLDSFAMVDLVSFIESQSGVRFAVLDMHFGNLDTLDKIQAILAKKLSQVA